MLYLRTFWNKKNEVNPRSVEYLVVPERVRGLKFFFLQHVDKNFYKLKPLNCRIQIAFGSRQHTFNVVYVSSFVMNCSFLQGFVVYETLKFNCCWGWFWFSKCLPASWRTIQGLFPSKNLIKTKDIFGATKTQQNKEHGIL